MFDFRYLTPCFQGLPALEDTSALRSFLVSNSISLYGENTFYVFTRQRMVIGLFLVFRHLWLMLLWTFVFEFLCGHVLFFFGGIDTYQWNCWDSGRPMFSISRNCQNAKSKWGNYISVKLLRCWIFFCPGLFLKSLALLVRFHPGLLSGCFRCSLRPLYSGWWELRSFLTLRRFGQLLSLQVLSHSLPGLVGNRPGYAQTKIQREPIKMSVAFSLCRIGYSSSLSVRELWCLSSTQRDHGSVLELSFPSPRKPFSEKWLGNLAWL